MEEGVALVRGGVYCSKRACWELLGMRWVVVFHLVGHDRESCKVAMHNDMPGIPPYWVASFRGKASDVRCDGD